LLGLEALPGIVDTSMPLPSFRSWLEDHRLQQVPDAGAIALLIARSGAAGVSREGLARAIGVPSEALEPLLRAMVVSGQVVMVKVGGELRYRAAG
jgi:hypothetical protein